MDEDEGQIGLPLPVDNDMAQIGLPVDNDMAQIGLQVDNDIAASDKVQVEDNHLQVLLLRKQAMISLQGMSEKGLWLS